MQHQSDDMDELFRKAADDYPLNTRTHDWNKIAAGLSQEITPVQPVKKSYRKFTWLLLLLPLVFLCNRIYNPGLIPQLSGTKEPGLSTTHNGEEQSINDRDLNTENKDSENKDSENKVSENKDSENNDKEAGNNKSVEDLNLDAKGKLKAGNDPQSQIHVPGTLKKANGRYSKTGRGLSDQSADQRVQLKRSVGVDAGTSNNSAGYESAQSNSNESTQTNPYLILPYSKTSLAPYDNKPDISIVPKQEMTKLLPGPVSKKHIDNKRFYLGLVGGLDKTIVDFQKTSKMGYHFGGIVGYTFGKRWSAEIGFFADRKYYYSGPEYFEKGKLPYRPNTTIMSVDGSCSMFEIPVSIKYDITNTYKSNFFVTAGLSSYIMKDETYTIVYKYNSSGSTSPHEYSYKNSSTNLFSEIRITGGYAVKLPKSFSIRVEPYLNIPVSGVGYGKLNLFSAGLNAGIFKRIF